MAPFGITATRSFGRGRGLSSISRNPPGYVVMIKLFAPDHPGERLSLDVARVRIGDTLLQFRKILIRFTATLRHHAIEILKRHAKLAIGQADTDRQISAGRDRGLIMGGGLRPLP